MPQSRMDSFMLPGYPGNEAETQTVPVEAVGGDPRPSVSNHTIPPAAWLWITLGLAILGLWFFLDNGGA